MTDTLWSVRRPVGDLRPGDHACLAYRCEEERRHVVGAFVRDGLLAREKVVYLSAVAAPRVPGVVSLPSRRLLSVITLDGDPRAALGRLAAEISAAERAGFRAIRVATDLTGADPESLLGCERTLDRLVAPSTSVVALCQLDRSRLPAGPLEELGAEHAVLAGPDPDFEDTVLRIVRTFEPRGLALAGELDASRHLVLDQALALVLSGADGADVHLDVAELRFIDLGALNMLAEVAARRAHHGPLILDRMPAQLQEVIMTVGWNMLPGLRLGAAFSPAGRPERWG
ncbi:MEDS domain-containing protein [Actinomadura flavalba]|uniref:MEDS domain-containing protein n=1 Tax=Actinomadura flavalba TaxID=1120938 RepID=UPI00036BB30C|nr:MEDS domain-containing protein [Actinomadura flavalba]